MRGRLYTICISLVIAAQGVAQAPSPALWHGLTRSIRYRPEGKDFVIENGERRFNRALYGTNTAFRVEAGDLPEFALYMPGMGGNLRFGIISGDTGKWLIRANYIRAVYRPGSMRYEIKDPLLGNTVLYITVLALDDGEGMILKVRSAGSGRGIRLLCAFGGASGKKFSRDGDIGADPESSFYLQPAYCTGNHYTLKINNFRLIYERGHALEGIFPPGKRLVLADAGKQGSPGEFLHSAGSAVPAAPALAAALSLHPRKDYYFLIHNAAQPFPLVYADLPARFEHAERTRAKLAGRVEVITPDPYINTLGGALAVAADAIWERPSYLHGAVAWRVRLNGWRGPYVADPLGWHDRARMHFSSYALSQIVSPGIGPIIADTALHLARQWESIGTFLFSNGYICRNPDEDTQVNHYDMNLVFIDELLDHFYWTGDTAYVRKMWPVLQRHLNWEKRNFDPDGDGLYDAYCCIWASDALQYSGGGVTHSSAYNYRANRAAAELAELIGEDAGPYRHEADKILEAINARLWLPEKGWYAEYLDRAGKGPAIIHPAAGLWTIYHTIDAHVPDPFRAYQALRYIDAEIPHIPILAKGLTDTSLYTLSTTNWLPYTWSTNNVVMAESLHTALAYWQAGRPAAAYPLWKGALVESMYLGASPGNFEQLSFYDAMRGELYRDFADPIGMAARSLVEGLFGICPDALHDTLSILPGWPEQWDHAVLRIPDISLDFSRTGDCDRYHIHPVFSKKMWLLFRVRAEKDALASVTINGRTVGWSAVVDPVNGPLLLILAPPETDYRIGITWKGDRFDRVPRPAELSNMDLGSISAVCTSGEEWTASFEKAVIRQVFDPQKALASPSFTDHQLRAVVQASQGYKTLFVRLEQGAFSWWQPLGFRAVQPFEIMPSSGQPSDDSRVWISNHTKNGQEGKLSINFGPDEQTVFIRPGKGVQATEIKLSRDLLRTGRNTIRFEAANGSFTEGSFTSWTIQNPAGTKCDTIGLAAYFNDGVNRIFKNQYRSPRPLYPTLQLPWQGIGNWCYPLVDPGIDDAGLRAKAGEHNEIFLPCGIPLATKGKKDGNNILFTSRWDNFPDSAAIPLWGKATHAYFLLAGSTNPMQSRSTNGLIEIHYKDGTADRLELNNPTNWWPIEQDDYEDGFAFSTGGPRPLRVSLKTGMIGDTATHWSTIKGFSNTAIDGGAATVLDMPLHPEKELDRAVLRTVANDAVIGLMSLTLMRN